MSKHAIGLAITPLAAYPLMAGALLSVDAVVGERALPFHVRHEQRLLWDTFWGDYASATPLMYLLLLVLVGLYFTLGRRATVPAFAYYLVVLPVIGWAAASYLTGTWTGSTQVALALAGALLGLPLAYFSRALGHRARPS